MVLHSSGLVSEFNNNVMEDSWEYMLVACPDLSDNYTKSQLKNILPETSIGGCGCKSYITLATFLARDSMEETLIRWMQRICSQFKCFNVTVINKKSDLRGSTYGLADNAVFSQLSSKFRVIDDYITSSGIEHTKWISDPRLTVVQGINCGIIESQDLLKRLPMSVQLSELVLFKRYNSFEKCKQVNVLRLNPLDTNMNNVVA